MCFFRPDKKKTCKELAPPSSPSQWISSPQLSAPPILSLTCLSSCLKTLHLTGRPPALLVAVPLAPLSSSKPLLLLLLHPHCCDSLLHRTHLLSTHWRVPLPSPFLSAPLLSSFTEPSPSISQPLCPVASLDGLPLNHPLENQTREIIGPKKLEASQETSPREKKPEALGLVKEWIYLRGNNLSGDLAGELGAETMMA